MTTTNAYDPRVHGVCGWARPVVNVRDADAVAAWQADPTSGRCSCGLEVRLTEPTEDDPDGVWYHYVKPIDPRWATSAWTDG